MANGIQKSDNNLRLEQKYDKYQNFNLKTLSFFVEKFSIYLNRRVFVMQVSKSQIHLTEHNYNCTIIPLQNMP